MHGYSEPPAKVGAEVEHIAVAAMLLRMKSK
jgi:hypothetical protein